MKAGNELVIMRGLPWTGKSYRAREIAGSKGVILSTDDYFYKMVRPDMPNVYTFDPARIAEAHAWNQYRAQAAIACQRSIVIIDNTNTTFDELMPYVKMGIEKGYRIRTEEPNRPRWHAIKELMADKKRNSLELEDHAERLSRDSEETHRVPAVVIMAMINRWQDFHINID